MKIKPFYRLILLALLFSVHQPVQAQQYTRQDTLRGANGPNRAWWDLVYYHLNVRVFPDQQSISGENIMKFVALKEGQTLQIDLQAPMQLTRVAQHGDNLKVTAIGNAYMVQLPKVMKAGEQGQLSLFFEGQPPVAKNPPWDGGFVWSKDSVSQKQPKHFIASACQGEGASLWWPCKDFPADEVDSMDISITVPSGLMDVSNGQLVEVNKNRKTKTTTYHWQVKNPINNYGVNINVADYASFDEIYDGEKGPLHCSYYVLKSDLQKAKRQFQQVPKMLKALEHWFGPYPFYEDGFKLVQTPYLGMEHQSSVTYGNGFKNGYKGTDLSGTGWGQTFDFIIVHEAGHEWFANNITNKDVADMWIHEGFTTYSEALYVEYYEGKEACDEYMRGIRSRILNDRPVIGHYGVNEEGSGDMYVKGACMLHTLRQIVNDDALWRSMLRGMNETFYHQTVSAAQIEGYMATKTGLELKPFFDQYLRTTQIPVMEYEIQDGYLNYRWTNCVADFNMPIALSIGGDSMILDASKKWHSLKLPNAEVSVEINQNLLIGQQFNGRFDNAAHQQ
ncbi:M1 family metallopeptidase [Persicobacter psychrovividus]|uniref:Peptidase M1 n=1 Tax=Persicobacter psychrovividus TaxID=387638 RepID=A0ABM7VKN7_9BACT|nr:peptidase M1 [Persicobacter psychrovividus]